VKVAHSHAGARVLAPALQVQDPADVQGWSALHVQGTGGGGGATPGEAGVVDIRLQLGCIPPAWFDSVCWIVSMEVCWVVKTGQSLSDAVQQRFAQVSLEVC
jgi:hypothetical protein